MSKTSSISALQSRIICGSLSCSPGLSRPEEIAGIGRIFSRFSERMDAGSLADELRDPRLVLYLLSERVSPFETHFSHFWARSAFDFSHAEVPTAKR